MQLRARKNQNLTAARRAKNDEFYTQLADIENELAHYQTHFAGQTVLCNCDDPRASNFVEYFARNFKSLRLKKLLAAGHKNQNCDLFNRHDSAPAVYAETTGDREENLNNRPANLKIKPLLGDGDFRGAECVAMLREADIVVTNPPFSLFREFVTQLMQFDKKFLILGNLNAITYKEIFPLLKNNKIWLGVHNMGMKEFRVPEHYPLYGAATRRDAAGNKFISLPTVFWYTNLRHNRRREELILTENYTPNKYPQYDNYNAINVDQVKRIPRDYDGVMGVPVTFLDKHNPDQFELLGMDKDLVKQLTGRGGRFVLNGKTLYARIAIRRK